KADKVLINLVPISHDPTEAGLIGAAYLAPHRIFEANDAIMAVDIGGTNIRAGVVVFTAPPFQGRGLEGRALAACRREEPQPRGGSQEVDRDAERLDRVRRRGGVASGAVHWNCLPRHHRSGWCHRPGRT